MISPAHNMKEARSNFNDRLLCYQADAENTCPLHVGDPDRIEAGT